MQLSSSQALLARYQDATLLAFAVSSTAVALRPSATIIPLIITLAVILFYSPFAFRRPLRGLHWRPFALWVSLSIGSAISKTSASLSALSDLGVSIFTLIIGSLLTSAFVILGLYLNTKASTRVGSLWTQLTLFPVLWASVWSMVAHVNPVGYLFTWTVGDGNDVYSWLTPILGPAGKDWLVGAWAVIASHVIGAWYIGPAPHVDEDEDHEDLSTAPKSQLSLAILLIALIVPSLFQNPLPLPFSDIDVVTPISVACILPVAKHYGHHTFSLDDFINESKKLRSSARILLWPEGAVSFDNTTHRDAVFETILEALPGPYIAVSFEETVPQESTDRQRIQKRTGIALLSYDSPRPHFIYYKRNLVPVAESFSLIPSTNPPPLYEAHLKAPVGTPKPDWAPPPLYTRPVPITASICLDFAHPSPFSSLTTKPGLILAPARTWDQVVGRAMYLQAKQRAQELDSHLLWCDGGDGGMSGVIGPGMGEVDQVGPGSFVRTFGLQYPFEGSSEANGGREWLKKGGGKTLYARFGTYWVISLFWVVAVGPKLLLRLKIIGKIHAWGQRVRRGLVDRRRQRALANQLQGQNTNYGTLIEVDD